MIKLSCECASCDREHEFFNEYNLLVKLAGGAKKLHQSRLVILLKDCDNGGYPFFLIAETENLKMGISLPRGTQIHEFVLGEFQPIRKTILN